MFNCVPSLSLKLSLVSESTQFARSSGARQNSFTALIDCIQRADVNCQGLNVHFGPTMIKFCPWHQLGRTYQYAHYF